MEFYDEFPEILLQISEDPYNVDDLRILSAITLKNYFRHRWCLVSILQ